MNRSRTWTRVLSRSMCFALAASCVLYLSAPAWGQATFGTITGRVTDLTGAVVPGAEVEVTNQATNVSKTVRSDAYGNYEATHLNPAVYTVTVECAGFKKFLHQDVMLEALATVRIDAPLEVGEVATQVTVSAGAPVVQSETSTISHVGTNRQLLDLPLNLRSVAPLYEYARLTPTFHQGGGSLRAFGGGRGTQTFFNVDGISSNSIVYGNQESNLQPATETIQEVKVSYVNNKAELADAGNLTVITKSGSNDFHGSGYWYHYNTALAARNFFAPTRGAIDPQTDEEVMTRHNLFGGSLGGPLKQDKAFFYVGYEYNFDPTAGVVTANVPTLKMRQGDFSELLELSKPISIKNPFTGQPFPGNVISSELHNAASLKGQGRFFPSPNFGSPETTAGNFRGSFSQDRRIDKVNSRIDYHFSPSHTLYGRFGFTRQLINGLPGGFLPADFIGGHARTLNRAPQVVISSTWTASPNVINEFKAGVARHYVTTGGPVPGQELIDFLGIEGLPHQPPDERASPDLRISGFQRVSWGGDNRRVANTFQVINQLTWIKGRHTLKMGGEFRPMQYNGPMRPGFGRYDFSKKYTGYSYADFLLGLPTSTQRTHARPLLYARLYSLSGFVQDDFKVSARLTLNYGLRYDFNSPAVDKYDILSTYDPATGSVVVPSQAALSQVHPLFPTEVPILTAEQAGFTRGLRNPDKNNFNPRFGFAYRPWANTRTVVRGGYGIFIDELTADILCAFLCRHGPFNLNEGFTNSIKGGVPLLTFDRPFLDVGKRLGALDVRGMDNNLRNPYVQQWNLTVEQDIGFSTGLRLSYIGTKSTRVTYRRNINQPLASTEPFSQSRRPYPLYRNILFSESGGNQVYHAFSLDAKRRMQRGLHFQLAWTWAKNLTDTEDRSEGGPTLENAYDRSGWRGDSQYEPRHRVIGNVIWELPFGQGRHFLNQPGPADRVLGGWQITATYVAQTGDYLTPTFSGADPSNTNTIGGIADRIGDGNLPGGQRSIDRWFDASAFAAPPNGRFGNSGRGVLIGPARHALNLGLFKRFTITERNHLRVQITATNALNHANFGNPSLNISSAGSVATIRSVQDRDFGGPREVMIGLRYEF